MRNRVVIRVSLSVLVLAAACGSDTTDNPAKDTTPAAAGSGASAPAAPATKTMTNDMTPPAAMTGAASGATITKDEMWSDGKMLAGNVDIAAGAKVQIATGAKLTAAAGTTITVHGSLEAAAKDNHAKRWGMDWMGIVVADGGSLALSGVDIDGAKEALHVNGANKQANYEYGTVSGGLFRVDTGGTLTIDHTAVVNGGYSFVSGTLKATFVDWSGAARARRSERKLVRGGL